MRTVGRLHPGMRLCNPADHVAKHAPHPSLGSHQLLPSLRQLPLYSPPWASLISEPKLQIEIYRHLFSVAQIICPATQLIAPLLALIVCSGGCQRHVLNTCWTIRNGVLSYPTAATNLHICQPLDGANLPILSAKHTSPPDIRCQSFLAPAIHCQPAARSAVAGIAQHHDLVQIPR
jgi:hypothetical protein